MENIYIYHWGGLRTPPDWMSTYKNELLMKKLWNDESTREVMIFIFTDVSMCVTSSHCVLHVANIRIQHAYK